MDEFSGRSDSLSTLVALHTDPVIPTPPQKLNNVIIEGVGENKDKQAVPDKKKWDEIEFFKFLQYDSAVRLIL